jgi:hypothetical protein
MERLAFGRLAALAVLLVTVSACVSAPPTTSFDKSTHAAVKNIRLMPVGMPEKPQVNIMAPVGANFGLIGAAVEAGRAANASREMTEILAKTSYDYKADIPSSVMTAMSDAGFIVTAGEGVRPEKERFKYLSTYPKEEGVDAYLDVFATYVGFLAAGATTDYRPTVQLSARLVNAADGKTIFQDQIVYGPAMPYMKAITVTPDDQHKFANRDALQANPEGTTAALKAAVAGAAAELAKQFQ